jgi:hypothetical protein
MKAIAVSKMPVPAATGKATCMGWVRPGYPRWPALQFRPYGFRRFALVS